MAQQGGGSDAYNHHTSPGDHSPQSGGPSLSPGGPSLSPGGRSLSPGGLLPSPGSLSPSPGGQGIQLSSLSLPTAKTAKLHLGSKKKSETKQVHPGYSMFDWTKICNSGRDLTGTNGKLLRVTPEELARHCTGDDLWTSVRGVIYNCTLFAKYHPGGKPQLMRGAGKDCTELFDKIHVWVNSEAILEKCIVGVLIGAKLPEKSSNLKVGIVKPPFPGNSDCDNEGETVFSMEVPKIALQNVKLKEEDLEPTENGDDDQVPPFLVVPPPPTPPPPQQNPDEEDPVPKSNDPSSDPVSSTEIITLSTDEESIPVPNNSVPSSGSDAVYYYYSQSYRNTYIHWHPLISRTAYETEV